MTDDLRNYTANQAIDFKRAWIPLAQSLYAIWKDKLYHAWGYEEFDQYVAEELGIKKSLAMKLIKTYFFIEQDEPSYLNNGSNDTEPAKTPSMDAMGVLRRAKGHKEITRQDYAKLRKDVFEKGRHEGLVAKELTAIIKERKQVDPSEEREKRATKSINNVVHALDIFTKEMNVIKLVPDEIVKESDDLRKRIEREAT